MPDTIKSAVKSAVLAKLETQLGQPLFERRQQLALAVHVLQGPGLRRGLERAHRRGNRTDGGGREMAGAGDFARGDRGLTPSQPRQRGS